MMGCHAVSSTSLLVCAWCWLCLMRQGSKGYSRGANIRVPTMSSTRLFSWKDLRAGRGGVRRVGWRAPMRSVQQAGCRATGLLQRARRGTGRKGWPSCSETHGRRGAAAVRRPVARVSKAVGRRRPQAALKGRQCPVPAAHLWPASWPTTKKPVKAVPASAQAKGSRYQGEMAMRYSDAAMAQMEVSTASQARVWFSSKTCAQAARSVSAGAPRRG